MSPARQLIHDLRARDPSASFAAIAQKVGCSKAAVVLWFNGKYPANAKNIDARVLAAYDQIDCPHLQQRITRLACVEFHSKDIPTSSPSALTHWRACQDCPYRQKHWHQPDTANNESRP